MPIQLSKAIEIIELNLKEASRKMPPDVKSSLELSVQAMKRVALVRHSRHTHFSYLLPGEAPETP